MGEHVCGGEGSSMGPGPGLDGIPLFPLPNVVLFPRAILPLHIFEERYKKMTADALGGRKTIAMALLRPGWEKDYYGTPAIEPVVCVGRILTSERLADGCYNFLLQGSLRATIASERTHCPYRVADLRPIAQTKVFEIDLLEDRQKLTDLLLSPPLQSMGGVGQFLQMLTSPMPTADIADLIAFNVLEDVQLKQSLLAEGDIRRRVRRLIDAVGELCAPELPLHYPVDPSVN